MGCNRSLVLAALALGGLTSLAGCGEDAGDGGGDAGVVRSEGGSAGGGSPSASEDAGLVQAGAGGSVGGAGGLTMRTDPEPPGPEAGPPSCDATPAEVLAEVLPNPAASLAGVSFNGDIPGFVDEVLSRRYPFGLELVQGGRRETAFGDCSVVYAEPASSAADIYAALEVVVHECGHVNDSFLSSGSHNVYAIHSDLSYECDRGDTTARGGDTFARSRITSDAYQGLRPPCATNASTGCDAYADVYLDGNPDDAVFDSGDQGFNVLMEEAVQYVNSIVTARAFADQQPQFTVISSRDGILTFLWYIERYLRMARTEFPSAYARITGDECWRDLTLAVWARAWRYLELTQDQPTLGIEDDAIEALVQDPELLGEIERLRALACP